MKKIILILFLLISCAGFGQEIKAMTYNIKYDNKNDTVNNWNDRKLKMTQLIMHYNPDFLGIQEGLHNQVIYLDKALDKYTYDGVGRDDGITKGEYSAIFFNKNKYKALENNTIWLSETPTKISVGWDASMERICTYGLFQNKKTKEKVLVLNTHFDHIGKLARKNSAKLIVKTIKKKNIESLPVILMGDFNLTPKQEAIATIKTTLNDSYIIAEKSPYGPKGTFNGFQNIVMKNRIDYIFVQGFKVKSVIHIDDKMDNNKHISDHIPVMARLTKK